MGSLPPCGTAAAAGERKPWAREHIQAFRNHWPIGTVQRLAFELLYWSAARTVDAVTLSPSMIRDGVMTFTQRKMGYPAHVPWTCALPDWCDQEFLQDRQTMASCLPSGVFTYLEAQGRVRSVKGLGNLVNDAARRIGIDRTAHGLRKSRLVAIAEAGGSVHAIMSWGGHRSLSEAQEYIDSADRRRSIMRTPQIKRAHTSEK